MENSIPHLAEYLLHRLNMPDSVNNQSFPDPTTSDIITPRRILVGICGVPASGKTTWALQLVKRINEQHATTTTTTTTTSIPTPSAASGSFQSHADFASRERSFPPSVAGDVAICVSQDGWHLSRAALDAFPDAKEAYDRRGAAFTFDGVSFSKFVLSLRETPVHDLPSQFPSPHKGTDIPRRTITGIIRAPGWSHTLKDPTPDMISIHPHHQIVIIEGLYTFLRVEPWRIAAEALDERWLVDVDDADGRERLIKRHVVTGVAKDMQEAIWRVDTNDIPNGLFLKQNMLTPSRIIRSEYNPSLVTPTRVE